MSDEGEDEIILCSVLQLSLLVDEDGAASATLGPQGLLMRNATNETNMDSNL